MDNKIYDVLRVLRNSGHIDERQFGAVMKPKLYEKADKASFVKFNPAIFKKLKDQRFIILAADLDKHCHTGTERNIYYISPWGRKKLAGLQ